MAESNGCFQRWWGAVRTAGSRVRRLFLRAWPHREGARSANPRDGRFVEGGRAVHARAIRSFCERMVSEGGVLVVAGPRGAGKSRLVDYALSSHEPDPGWRDWLRVVFGDSGARRRLRVRRAPRRVYREVIRVDVDPFSPHLEAGGAPVWPLLRNVVFALTSTLDPRHSQRRFGRSLRSRLGFFGYWFSPSALYLSPAPACPWQRAAVWVLATLWTAAWCALTWLSLGPPAPTAAGLFALPLLALAVTAGGWAWLRQRDFDAVARMGGRLYDLVHAERTRQRNQEIQERSYEIKRSQELRAALTALLGGGLLTAAGPALQQAMTPESRWAALIAGLIAMAVGGTTLVIRFLRRDREELSADFGNHNIAWMITLLRRYLFLLHRCGIEPVLVLDELDKLESGAALLPLTEGAERVAAPDTRGGDATASAEAARTAPPGPAASESNRAPESAAVPAPDAPPTTPLERLLYALLRLKHSLGAEFFWILVGGVRLPQTIHRDRSQGQDGVMGPLATLSQYELTIGPMSFKEARHYLRLSRAAVPSSHYDVGAALGFELAWIRAQGNYANLRRLIEERPRNAPAEQRSRALFLASGVRSLWRPAAQRGLIALDDASLEEGLTRGWTQTWLHIGMLRFAAELMEERDVSYYSLVQELERAVTQACPAPPEGAADEVRGGVARQALTCGAPEALVQLGRMLLYQRLKGVSGSQVHYRLVGDGGALIRLEAIENRQPERKSAA